MPDCNGSEIAAVIRQQEAYVGIPIMFLSSESDTLKQLEAMRLGGDEFLQKTGRAALSGLVGFDARHARPRFAKPDDPRQPDRFAQSHQKPRNSWASRSSACAVWATRSRWR